MKTTGDIIKELREARKMSKQKLAELVGTKSYTTITKWESDENHPRGREIKRLCDIFRVSADYLLGLEENHSSEYEIESDLYTYRYKPVKISAGVPITVDGIGEEDFETITLPDELMGKWARNDDIYFVKSNGDSMNKIFPDDSLLGVKTIHHINELKDNDIVIFNYDNEYSVKRFKIDVEGNKIIFRPESTEEMFTDLVIKGEQIEFLEIIGKVVVYVVTQ